MNRSWLTILVCSVGLFFFAPFASAGVILSGHKYAWSNNVGYINFEKVIVGDSALSGYAWSENSGWIKFNPSYGGVSNDGTGNLSGSAWGEQLGWIDFENVSINSTTGKFSGTATGTLVGTITFDCPNYCDVQTDWREVVAVAAINNKENNSKNEKNDHSKKNQALLMAPSNQVGNLSNVPPIESALGAPYCSNQWTIEQSEEAAKQQSQEQANQNNNPSQLFKNSSRLRIFSILVLLLIFVTILWKEKRRRRK